MPILASVLLASQAAGMASAPRVADPRDRPAALRECVTVQIELPSGRPVGSRLPAFSARDVAEIELTARAERPLGGRQLELRLFLPDGHLYHKVGLEPVAPSGSNHSRHAPTTPDRSRLGTARLPVAGTAITMSSLYGTWSVVPYLDGRPAACGPSLFVIRP